MPVCSVCRMESGNFSKAQKRLGASRKCATCIEQASPSTQRSANNQTATRDHQAMDLRPDDVHVVGRLTPDSDCLRKQSDSNTRASSTAAGRTGGSADEEEDEEMRAVLAASLAAAEEKRLRDERIAQQQANQEAELAAVLAASLVVGDDDDDTEDEDMRAALEASLDSGNAGGPADPEEEDELRAVLAASLAAAEEQRKIDENIARLIGSGPAAADNDASHNGPPLDSVVMEVGTCPLCMEDLDEQEKLFLPCPCGFQLCLFCYNRIKEDTSGSPGAGLCPGCRTCFGEPMYKQPPTGKLKQGSKRRGKR